MVEAPAVQKPFASNRDYEACRRLHRQFGTTYYFATLRFPRRLRKRVHAVYGFVRIPDEWVDNPENLTRRQQWTKLQEYRKEFLLGLEGVPPESRVLRAFCDVCREVQMPVEEPELFLDAMEDDLSIDRYATYGALREYMRGSAAAVGLMMCHAFEVPLTEEIKSAAIALGEAMQMTNFLRDVGEDLKRARIYLPAEDLESFALSTVDLPVAPEDSEKWACWKRLMQFEIERTRALYRASDAGIALLPNHLKRPVKLARILYGRILDRIEANGYDVFSKRARTGKLEKLACAVRLGR